jgi:hypothetical protein
MMDQIFIRIGGARFRLVLTEGDPRPGRAISVRLSTATILARKDASLDQLREVLALLPGDLRRRRSLALVPVVGGVD